MKATCLTFCGHDFICRTPSPLGMIPKTSPEIAKCDSKQNICLNVEYVTIHIFIQDTISFLQNADINWKEHTYGLRI